MCKKFNQNNKIPITKNCIDYLPINKADICAQQKLIYIIEIVKGYTTTQKTLQEIRKLTNNKQNMKLISHLICFSRK